MGALLDAVTDLDLGSDGTGACHEEVRAQVRILEVASPTEISAALTTDRYHVLHLSANGSATHVELEDEDGNPHLVGIDRLVAALRGGGHPLPLVALSQQSRTAGSTT